eukprot:Gb_24127 [translate_table: standard]
MVMIATCECDVKDELRDDGCDKVGVSRLISEACMLLLIIEVFGHHSSCLAIRRFMEILLDIKAEALKQGVCSMQESELCWKNGIVMHSQQFIAKFEEISLDISQVLSSLPLSSLPIPDQTRTLVECCIEELQRAVYASESADERTAEDIENALRDHREGLKVGPLKLKSIADKVALTSNQEVLREACALEKEKDYVVTEKRKQEEDYINQVIGLVTQMCEYMLELKLAQTNCGVPIPEDFRCPLSLELMLDPVMVASGQTYEREYIQKWLDQGMTMCPTTRQTLDHTCLIPNYTVKAMISNWCESNNVPLPEPPKVSFDAPHRSQPSQLCPIQLHSNDGMPPVSGKPNEDHGSEKEHLSFPSETREEQGILIAESVQLTDGKQQKARMREQLNTNEVNEQPEGHSSIVSGLSVASSLDNGKPSTDRDASVPEEIIVLSDYYPSSSSSSGELALSSIVPQYINVKSAARIPERGCDGAGSLSSWRQQPDDQNSMDSISSSSLPDMKDDGSGIQLHVKKLAEDLQTNLIEVQRAAAAELRLLAKHNTENRITIANFGAIRPLVALLHCCDSKIQEDAVTALLNLSLYENNKNEIVAAGSVNSLVHVLKTGNPRARENAAATLFSISSMKENKIIIGQSGAIPALVDLLMNGSARGKKDAVTALFNLSIVRDNKALIVQAGAVKPLVQLMDPAAGMVDKAVAVLSNLSSIPEGRRAIGEEGGISALVEVVEIGSQRGKENAAAALLQLCTNSNRFHTRVLQEGAIPPLVALSQSGTPRAKEKVIFQLVQSPSLSFLSSTQLVNGSAFVHYSDTAKKWLAQALLRHFREQRHAALARAGVDRHMDRHCDQA